MLRVKRWVAAIHDDVGEDEEAVAEETQHDDHCDQEGIHVLEHLIEQDGVDCCICEQPQPVEQFDPHSHLQNEDLPQEGAWIDYF